MSDTDRRRFRKFEKSGTEHIGPWLRFGPNEPLPHSMGTSGKNGCFYSEDTREILRFKDADEISYKMLGPRQLAKHQRAGPKGGDFNLTTQQMEEPRNPYDSFYDDMTYDVQYDA
ncbi:hypothetical protein GEMRC1_011894 [Eukaryota sp. GEM-RC1]